MTSRCVSGALGWFGAAMGLSCAQEVTAPRGEIMLESLQFARSEVQAGEPLIVIAQPATGESVVRQPLLVRTSSGGRQQTFVSPWDGQTDKELTVAIAQWGGRAFIGFKEADARRGVDEHGFNITSSATVERMKQWVREQGMTITLEYQLTPTVVVLMAPDEQLVSRIRHHENVDHLEPVTVGSYGAESEGGKTEDLPLRLAAVIPTSPESGGRLSVRRGDTITAEYHQPNGAVLTATASIR